MESNGIKRIFTNKGNRENRLGTWFSSLFQVVVISSYFFNKTDFELCLFTNISESIQMRRYQDQLIKWVFKSKRLCK